MAVVARRNTQYAIDTTYCAADRATDDSANRSRRVVAAPGTFIHASEYALCVRNLRNGKHRCQRQRECQRELDDIGSTSGNV
jgi:hypothetical protein